MGLESVIMVEPSGVGPGEHHAWNVKVGLDPQDARTPKTLGPEYKKHQSKSGVRLHQPDSNYERKLFRMLTKISQHQLNIVL